MKKTLLLAAMLFSVAATAADTSASAAFDKLKTLAGTWERMQDGKTHTSTWSAIASGSVMMEEMQPENVITMYYMDADRLLITHYCLMKNQPRMAAEVSPNGKTITFNFLDITNLASPDAKHMRRIVMTLEDANHFTQEWLLHMPEKDKTGVFHYTRKQ